MIGQSKHHSLLESMVNVAIGYGVAFVSQLIIFPWYGIHIPIASNLMIGAWFTAISIIRSYVLRRAFNMLTIKKINQQVASMQRQRNRGSS